MLQLNNTSRLIFIMGGDLEIFFVLVSIYYWTNKVSLWVWFCVISYQPYIFLLMPPSVHGP